MPGEFKAGWENSSFAADGTQSLPRTSSAVGGSRVQFAGAAHAVRTSKHLAKRTSVGYMMPLMGSGGVGESFMHPTGEECEAMWEHSLIHYGGMMEGDARQVATIFSAADIPPPSNDCRSFMTHEFLISLGISAPGDRARIILAIERMPPPSLHLGGLQVDEHQLRMASVAGNGASTPASYSENTSRVKMFVLKSRDNTLTWVDLVGKDAHREDSNFEHSEYSRSYRKIQKLFDTAPEVRPPPARTGPSSSLYEIRSESRVQSQQHQQQQHSGAGAGLPAQAQGEITSPAHGPTSDQPQSPVERSSPERFPSNGLGVSLGGSAGGGGILNPSHATEDADLWGIMRLETPLPHMVHDPSTPGRCAFILRVCTAGTDPSDASFGALTNRWVVFADQGKNLVSIVHRVDSVSLATLRDKDFGAMSDTITFKRVLASIFVSFLMEFEIALDRGNELLDDCETNLLDHTKHSKLLESLFHLERKASVYERMIDLNQSLVAEIGHYFNLSREIAYLETKWQRLREKAVALGERSSNLLQLLLALGGHRTNELMAVLTRFSLVFTPMTFIAGVYGMNFVNMPELQYENGYYVLLGVMAVMFVVGSILSSRL